MAVKGRDFDGLVAHLTEELTTRSGGGAEFATRAYVARDRDDSPCFRR